MRSAKKTCNPQLTKNVDPSMDDPRTGPGLNLPRPSISHAGGPGSSSHPPLPKGGMPEIAIMIGRRLKGGATPAKSPGAKNTGLKKAGGKAPAAIPQLPPTLPKKGRTPRKAK